jgi:hypothetical protein
VVVGAADVAELSAAVDAFLEAVGYPNEAPMPDLAADLDVACAGPSDSGEECNEDGDCCAGLVCGPGNGPALGLPAGASACWPAYCIDFPDTVGCSNIPTQCQSDAHCTPYTVCGVDNGAVFGLNSTDRVCWPALCDTDPVTGGCGSAASPVRTLRLHAGRGTRGSGPQKILWVRLHWGSRYPVEITKNRRGLRQTDRSICGR